MSIASENLMRLASTGYGGGQGASPYNLHASLLADASSGLATKRYKDEAAMARERLDQLIKESEFRNSMTLAQSGFGTQKELNAMGQPYNLSYGTGGSGLSTPGGVSTGLASSKQPVDIASILKQYQGTQPYSWQTQGGQRNMMYDPNLANYNKNLARVLAQYRG